MITLRGWQPGAMRGQQTLRLLKAYKASRRNDRYARGLPVIDQGTSTASASHALWHLLVAHDRAFIGIAPDGLATLSGNGRSLEAQMQLLTNHGLASAAYWMASAQRVHDALGIGPVLLGAPLFQRMQEPWPTGLIEPLGPRCGSHCWLIVGFDPGRDAFRLVNSFGPAWGQLGRCWLASRDLDQLFALGAEACVPVLAAAASERFQKVFAAGIRS